MTGQSLLDEVMIESGRLASKTDERSQPHHQGSILRQSREVVQAACETPHHIHAYLIVSGTGTAGAAPLLLREH